MDGCRVGRHFVAALPLLDLPRELRPRRGDEPGHALCHRRERRPHTEHSIDNAIKGQRGRKDARRLEQRFVHTCKG